MKNLFILFLFISVNQLAFAQNTLAKIKFEDAEKAFNEAKYEACIKLLDETEEILGQGAPNILYLRILATNEIVKSKDFPEFSNIQSLRNFCSYYITNYDIDGLNDKFREVYEIQKTLNSYPLNEADFNKAAKETKDSLQQIEEERIDSVRKTIDSLYPMVEVVGGSFIQGTDKRTKNLTAPANPPHQVTVSTFSIGKFEVTQDLWQKIMGSNPSMFKSQKRPVENISWEDANMFIVNLNTLTQRNYRLPTEAEWNFAAQDDINLNDDMIFGNLKKYAVYYNYNVKFSKRSTSPVGTKEPNGRGIYDMLGNVGEYCADWYAPFDANPKIDPKGPESGDIKVIKGGSISITDQNTINRSTRWVIHFRRKFESTGFRLVLSNQDN